MPDFTDDPDVLVQRYLEETLSEAEAALLLERLQSEPILGERLLGALSLDAMLRDLKGGAPAVPIPQLPRRSRGRFSVMALVGVAALAACVTLAVTWVLFSEVEVGDEDESTTAAVAVLARSVHVVWEDTGGSPVPGTPLSPGWLRLKSGVAQIEFYQGARVTLEGPAALQLISSSEAFCSAGRLSAHVPPQAKGFRIRTDRGTVVDLGTDFGLDLTGAAGPQVHVFKGEVEWHPQHAQMRSLKEGQALSMDAATGALAADAQAFASLADLEQRNADSERLAFEDWLMKSRRVDEDAGLLLRFDFQDPAASRSLLNHAVRAPQVPAGSIVGCDWTEGQWSGKRALEFRNVSDRVRVSVPGEYRDLTLSTWIRVNGLDRAFNSLFMLEGYKDGAVHWQITRQGVLRLGIAGRQGHPSVDYDTPVLFTPERFGQWLHLVTVYDAGALEVRHYLDGNLVAALPVKHGFPLRLGLAELGNWNDGSGRVPVRHFSGAMQEFMLFQRVLSEAEIRGL
ncbi:MAG TPA: LamG-like jellyroll fold domain-containing protein [Prosthecobacter sp.]|nr:LamG-like jellyroll fold domain-containing protein [Prosthecobacter sp.]